MTAPSYSCQLTDHILGIGVADIPETAYDTARRLLVDTYACALAGRQAPGIDAVVNRMRDWGGKPEAQLLFADDRLPMPNAAFANSAMIHAMDLDDIYTPGTLHLTSVIVPAMLAAADVTGVRGRDALAAMILGIEMAARIGVAEHSRRRGQGFLPTSLAGSFGAVITAARLLGLSRDQTVHALGINYAQISGNRQALLDASLTKRLQPAFAARSALWAVDLARTGITGPHRIFEGDAGYFKTYMNGDVPDVEELLKPFDAFAVDHVSLKRFPSCGAAHSHQNAAERLREEEDLQPADIARVGIFNVASIVAEPFRLNENPQVVVQFSAAWGVAHALLRGRATLADYTNDAIREDHEVCELAQRIVAIPDPDDLPPPPHLHTVQAGSGGAARARYRGVIVYTRDGRRLMRCEAPCQTFPPHPFPWPEVERKFHDCAAFAGLGRDEAQAILDSLLERMGRNVAGSDGKTMNEDIAERRAEYLDWIVETFGKLNMDPRDGRRWALNHARLALNRSVDEANAYFASFAPPGLDNDIYLIRFLRTLLDFRGSPQLSDAAEKHIIGFIETWPTRREHLATRAHWPPSFTENHDLMYLTLALFGEQYRDGDCRVQVREIKRFIAHRMEHGFVEWNSQCYQYHLSNPLIILADHAPDEGVRDAARMLLNVMLAGRAVLGVRGFLGGPSLRCRTADVDHSLTARKVAYLSDGRYDGFLATVWLAFGLGEPRFDFTTARDPELEPATIHIASGNEPRLKQDEGMFFACSRFLPHPVVQALAEETRTRKALVYRGRRFLGWPDDELWKTQKWLPAAITYYNTPHVSMGSVHSDGWNHQSRYNSVLFGDDPSQALRVETILPGVKPHKRRHEARGRVVQHENWLVAQGTLFEDGCATAESVGWWNVYQVGRGLCAHIALGDDYHVLQVSDLDTFTSREEFIAALSLPARSGDRLEAVTMGGDRLTVDLTNMGIAINGTPRPHPPEMLHDCKLMTSVYGSGKIIIRSTEGTVTWTGDGSE